MLSQVWAISSFRTSKVSKLSLTVKIDYVTSDTRDVDPSWYGRFMCEWVKRQQGNKRIGVESRVTNLFIILFYFITQFSVSQSHVNIIAGNSSCEHSYSCSFHSTALGTWLPCDEIALFFWPSSKYMWNMAFLCRQQCIVVLATQFLFSISVSAFR